MTNQDPLKACWSFASSRRKPAPLDFKEIERIHKEWERYDISGRMVVVPNDPKGPRLKASPEFKHGGALTMRSSGDKD